MFKKARLISFFFLVLLCSISFARNKNDIIARIGNKTITVEEFDKRYEQNANLNPSKSLSKKEVLNNIIYFELAIQQARKENLHLDPTIQDQINILLYQELVQKKVQPKIDQLRISEGEVRDYFQQNPLIQTRHIVLLTRPDMDEKERAKVKERANNIYKKVLEKKQSFEELAKEYSEGPSAKTGGRVDWGARHKLLSEYYEAALSLKTPGKVSGIVETPYGFHIIQLTGKREYAEIDPVYKDYIIRTIKEIRGKKVYDTYFDELKTSTKISTNESLL